MLQHFAPELEKLGATFNRQPAGRLPSPVQIARVDCWAHNDLCNSYGIKTYPKLYIGTPAQWKSGPGGGQTLASGLLNLTGDAIRNSDTISEALIRITGADVAITSREVFNTELTNEIQSRAESTAPTARADDSWTAMQVSRADVELSLVLTVQNLLRGLHGAAIGDKAVHVKQTVEVAKLLLNTGPDYEMAGNVLIAHLSSQNRMREDDEHPNQFLERWKPFGNSIDTFKRDWQSCNGLFNFQRGYPCGLWQLLHVLTVGATDGNAVTTMQRIKTLIGGYFQCQQCRENFVAMAKNINREVSDRKSAVLWLWRAHNSVSQRLLKEDITSAPNPFKEDKSHPKRWWPTHEICAECRDEGAGAVASAHAELADVQSVPWNEAAVLSFLTEFFAMPAVALRGPATTNVVDWGARVKIQQENKHVQVKPVVRAPNFLPALPQPPPPVEPSAAMKTLAERAALLISSGQVKGLPVDYVPHHAPNLDTPTETFAKEQDDLHTLLYLDKIKSKRDAAESSSNGGHDAFFKAADTDGDGVISQREFAAARKQFVHSEV